MLSGFAYGTSPSKLRCTIWLDDPVDKAEAEAWVDAKDYAPFGGLNVIRFKDENAPQLGGPRLRRDPDEFALRFVFTEDFDNPAIRQADEIARRLAHEWHWRYVNVPNDATQAVVDVLLERDEKCHAFRWFSDDANRTSYFARRFVQLSGEQSELEASGAIRFIAEVRNIRTMELGKVRAVPQQKSTKQICEDIRTDPWLLLPQHNVGSAAETRKAEVD